MTKTQRIEATMVALTEWAARIKECDAVYESAKAVMGANPDSPLWDAVFRLQTAYTKAISAQVGDDDEWLEWYHLECDMGKKPMEVTYSDGRKIKVKTLRDLARVIFD